MNGRQPSHESGASEGDGIYHAALREAIRRPDQYHDSNPDADVESDGYQSGRLGCLLAKRLKLRANMKNKSVQTDLFWRGI